MLEDLSHENWLEYLPYVVMAVIVVLIWKLQTFYRLQKTPGNNGHQSASGDMLNNSLSLKELVEAGKIDACIDRNLPLNETAETHRYVETGQRTG